MIDPASYDQICTTAYMFQSHLCYLSGFTSVVEIGSPKSGDIFLTTNKATGVDQPAGKPHVTCKLTIADYVTIQADDGVALSNGTRVLLRHLKRGFVLHETAVAVENQTAEVELSRAEPPESAAVVYQVNCGGGAVAPFSSDGYFIGSKGQAETGTGIALTGVVDPAPEAVYRSERYGQMAYAFTVRKIDAIYLVRLHFAENYYAYPGQRLFNVAINGVTALDNFDIVAAAQGPHRAVVAQFKTTPNSDGSIVIRFIQGAADVPKVGGIEILYLRDLPDDDTDAGHNVQAHATNAKSNT